MAGLVNAVGVRGPMLLNGAWRCLPETFRKHNVLIYKETKKHFSA